MDAKIMKKVNKPDNNMLAMELERRKAVREAYNARQAEINKAMKKR